MREIQRGTRTAQRPKGINPTTIHDAFSAPRLARWEVVEAIVQRLDGQASEFAELWRAAREAETLDRRGAATQDPQPDERPGPQAAASPTIAPRQLPPDVFAFTGRDASLAAMDHLLDVASDPHAAVVVSALAGTAGVGKTALAVHWAHRVAARFPDGQLYVDLRGYGPEQPVTPHHALAGFLRSLGVSSSAMPYELSERAALYRSLTAGRRLLVLLDNARTAEQVRPLLPGSSSCAALVTSRDSLASLVARDGARRIDLDLLSPDEAVALLHALVGPRADTEPAAVDRLAERCARLPLALRIAAELAAARPSATLDELVADLDDERRRLELLDRGVDRHTSIQSVFSWSYHELAPPHARLFQLLGINPTPDIDPYAAAALAGSDVTAAHDGLDALTRAHLVTQGPHHRYAMHDLLLAYATRLAEAQPESERSMALGRLLDYYLAVVTRAVDTAFPTDIHSSPATPDALGAAPPIDEPAAARAWLDDTRDTLVAVVRYAADGDWPDCAARIAAVLFTYLHNGAHHWEAAAVHTAALRATTRLDDRARQGEALTNLGAAYWRLGQYEFAASTYKQARDMYGQVDDRVGEARVLANLGAVYYQLARYDQAADCCRQALNAYRVTGFRLGEADALVNLGAVLQRQGYFDPAAHCHAQALAMYQELDDRAGEARALDNIGTVRRRQGRRDEAIACHEGALSILCEIGDRVGQAKVLESLGNVDCEQQRYEQALARYSDALDIATQIGSQGSEVSARNGAGETLSGAGQTQRSAAQHESALKKAQITGDRYEQARALNGLAHARQADGDHDTARRFWQDALAIYTEIGVPEADIVRSRLQTEEVPADSS